MVFNGNYVDNGLFSEIIYDKSQTNTFTISNSFELSESPDKITKDTTTLRDLRRLYYNHNIPKFVIKYSITLVNGDDFIYQNKIEEVKIHVDIYKKNAVDYSSSVILKKVIKNKYNVCFNNIPDVSGRRASHNIGKCTCYFSGMSLNSIYQDLMDNDIKLFVPTIVSIFNIISNQYLQLKYIAPLRENPKRRYIADKNVDDVGITGENTPLLLKKVSKKLWDGINAPKSENDFILSKSSRNKDAFLNILNSWMNYLDLGKVFLKNEQTDIIKVNINKHNIADVGFGVSQALPILTEGIFLSHNQTLLLEQPEIHLHPKMQMKMADFLLSLSIQNKSIIVETHSDHIINRIVRRYMEDEGIRDKVKIYFLDKNVASDESSVTEITIDEVDGAICENENFFYQFASETEKIIDAGYKNLETRRMN